MFAVAYNITTLIHTLCYCIGSLKGGIDNEALVRHIIVKHNTRFKTRFTHMDMSIFKMMLFGNSNMSWL